MKTAQKTNDGFHLDRLLEEDFLYLLLALIDYPDKNPGILDPHILRKIRFKKLNWENCFSFLLLLQDDVGIKVKEMPRNFPQIEVGKKAIGKIWNEIENYLKRFISGELIPLGEEYFEFEKQKIYFLKKIRKKLEDGMAKTFSLYDHEIENGYRLFESLLILETQNYLEIKTIYNSQKPEEHGYFYRIVFEAKNKLRKNILPRKRRLSPECFSSGDKGFFRVKKNSREKFVGKANSRHFLLLKFLVENGVGQISSFKEAFEAIRRGKYYSKKSHHDEEFSALENAKKRLQKDDIISPFSILINPETRTIQIL